MIITVRFRRWISFVFFHRLGGNSRTRPMCQFPTWSAAATTISSVGKAATRLMLDWQPHIYNNKRLKQKWDRSSEKSRNMRGYSKETEQRGRPRNLATSLGSDQYRRPRSVLEGFDQYRRPAYQLENSRRQGGVGCIRFWPGSRGRGLSLLCPPTPAGRGLPTRNPKVAHSI